MIVRRGAALRYIFMILVIPIVLLKVKDLNIFIKIAMIPIYCGWQVLRVVLISLIKIVSSLHTIRMFQVIVIVLVITAL